MLWISVIVDLSSLFILNLSDSRFFLDMAARLLLLDFSSRIFELDLGFVLVSEGDQILIETTACYEKVK